VPAAGPKLLSRAASSRERRSGRAGGPDLLGFDARRPSAGRHSQRSRRRRGRRRGSRAPCCARAASATRAGRPRAGAHRSTRPAPRRIGKVGGSRWMSS
jgi:hypothetical protein